MIDLHSHILPLIDDGSDSMERTVAMARLAVDEGIHILAATPHHMNGRYMNPAEGVIEAVRLVNDELRSRQIPLEIIPGQEIRLTDHFWTEWEQGKLLPLNHSRYVLIELPSQKVPASLSDFIHEMIVQGLVPIIAHPERNAQLAADLDLMQEYIQQGAWGQVTSHSLNGLFGGKVKKTAIQMCKRNLIHIVSSDAHDDQKRPFGMKEAYDQLEKELGKGYVRYYSGNAKAVIENQQMEPWRTKKEKRWYQVWR